MSQARAAAPTPGTAVDGGSFGKAKACILLYLSGGPPQHETWDPKPDAPAEIRGDFRPIASSVPGLHVGELMPQACRPGPSLERAARRFDLGQRPFLERLLDADRAAVCPAQHRVQRPRCQRLALSGRRGQTAAAGKRGLASRGHVPAQMISNANIVAVGQNAGFLGRAADPWVLNCDPSAADFRAPALDLPDGGLRRASRPTPFDA